MIRRIALTLLCGVMGLVVASNANGAITLNVAAIPNSNMMFDSDGTTVEITLTDSPTGLVIPPFPPFGVGRNFFITSVFGGVGDSVGVLGDIEGTFTYTAADITATATGETALLSSIDPPGTQLVLGPAGGSTFTADIVGIRITTEGVGGSINTFGVVNISNASYAGTNADLTQFAAEINSLGGVGTLTFQLAKAVSLTSLLNSPTGGVTQTSYSGSFTSAVPEPNTIISALPLLMIGGGLYLRRRKVA
jgi:hypothetical protein